MGGKTKNRGEEPKGKGGVFEIKVQNSNPQGQSCHFLKRRAKTNDAQGSIRKVYLYQMTHRPRILKVFYYSRP